MSGVLALVGGRAWDEGCDFDRDLLEASGGSEVAVLPTAAAYEQPALRVEAARRWFGAMGATVVDVPVLTRRDALVDAHAELVASSRFVYLSGGSPLHLRSVLKDSPVWDAIVRAWDAGAVVAGSSAGAQVLADPMVDPRGGAYTLGLGLLAQVAVIPHADQWSEEKAHRTIRLAAAGLPVVGLPDRTAVIRGADGRWRAAGVGQVTVHVDGEPAGLDRLP